VIAINTQKRLFNIQREQLIHFYRAPTAEEPTVTNHLDNYCFVHVAVWLPTTELKQA